MADDYGWIADLAKYAAGTAGAQGANAVTQGAYAEILKNLKERFGEYDALKPAGYQSVVPERLGDSALSGIAPDAQSRLDEQAAIAQLDDIASSGGLTLADRQALAELESTLSRRATARNLSTANQFAARGTLDSGKQLAMQMAANQNANETANNRGETIAAEAQKRAMEAVLAKGRASHAMSKEDYDRQSEAAKAEDAIDKYNASMSTDVQRYNNALRGQAYDDEMKRLTGKTSVTGQINDSVLGSGKQNANTIAGQAYGTTGLIDSISKYGRKTGGDGYDTTPPPNTQANSGSDPGDWNQWQNPDETGERGGAADISDDEEK